MNELLDISFTGVNTSLSILLVVSVLYWLFTIVAGVDADLDIEFDTDIDIDSDVEALDSTTESNIDVENTTGNSTWIDFLRFLNLDAVPLTMFFTLWILIMWFVSVNVHSIWAVPNWLGYLLLIPIAALAIVVLKFITQPLKPFLKKLYHKGEQSIDFLGRSGILISNISDERLGQVEVMILSDPVRIMAKSFGGKELLSGTNVEIVNESDDGKYFVVKEKLTL